MNFPKDSKKWNLPNDNQALEMMKIDQEGEPDKGSFLTPPSSEREKKAIL